MFLLHIKKIEKKNIMDQVMHEKMLNPISYTLNVHQFTFFMNMGIGI
jgi:hypothetical protein